MAYYKIPNPDDLMECPYDKVHMVAAKRMQYHLMKCRRNYSGREFASCPFNARHEMPKPELRYHIANCPDKAMLEPILSYEQSKNSEDGQNFKGCTDLPRYDDSYSSRNSENWDEEIPENPRIGVDPAFFARMDYKDLTGMSRSEKKAWKTQLNLPPEQRRLPMQQDDEFEEEEETTLRKPKIKPTNFKVNKSMPTQNPVLSYSLAMAGIGRGGGAQGIGMPPAQPSAGGRGAGRAQIMGMNGVAMNGSEMMPPMGRAMGRARPNAPSGNVAMSNQNGHAVINGDSRMGSAPPGFMGQFDNATKEDETFNFVGRGSSPQKTGSYVPAGIGRGRGLTQAAQPPSFTVTAGRGQARDMEGSPAFVVPKVSSPQKQLVIDDQDTNNNIEVDADAKAKEMKKIEKKLKQIEMLEEKGELGYTYNSEELKKIQAKDKLLQALENLKL